MKKLFALLVLICCVSSPLLLAQTYELGLTPSKLKWYQLKTDKVQVVFPKGLDAQAQRIANLVHFLADTSNTQSIGNISEPVSIFLQNQTTIPNGFVAISPFRSEFFTTPPQFNFAGSSNWMDLLTIHEYRHVQQNQNAKIGITKFMSVLFGQNGWGFMTGMAIPRWYSEGDAIIAETSFTHSGRGRTPDFDKEYRSLRLEGRRYNYEKASAGSFKDFVPNHYQLGYYMVSHARNHFGKDVWANVLNGAGKYKGIFYPFSHTLKKETSLGTKQLYKETMTYLDSLYTADLAKLELTKATKINRTEKVKYTDYRHPQFLDNDRIIVEKSGFDEIRTYYIVEADGSETELYPSGFNIDLNASLSVKNNTLVWSEITFHPRWYNKDFSILKRAPAIPSSKKQKLTHRTKYFAPDLSFDESKIIAVQTSEQVTYNLVIVNPNTGELMETLENPENYFFAFPRWMSDNKHIVVTIAKDNQNALVKINSESGEMTLLTEFTNEQIANPYPGKDHVFFTASYTGINNIYAVKTDGSKSIYQVTSTKLGAFQPAVSPDGKTLAYSEFSSLGYDLMTMPIHPNEWKVLAAQPDNILQIHRKAEEEEGGAIFEKIPTEKHEVKRYSKFNGALQLHSWNPIVSDPFEAEGGIELEIDNKLSTISATGGYIYNGNENNGRFYGELAYGQFWPILRVGYTGKNERDRSYPYVYATYEEGVDTLLSASIFRVWDEESVNFGVTLPFNLTQGNIFSNLELSADYERIKLDYTSVSLRTRTNHNSFENIDGISNLQADETIGVLDLNLIFSGNQQRARQNIYPKFGYFFGVRHRRVLGNSVGQGETTLLRTRFFLPGLFRNHGTMLIGQYQFASRFDTYGFRNQFAGSRGYGAVNNDGAYRLSANYTFPIAYPDLALGSFAFIQRLKGTLFFDAASYQLDGVSAPLFGRERGLNDFQLNLTSVGFELTTDFRAFRLLDVDLGARYSYKIDYELIGDSSPHSIEFLLVRISP
ncbi:MAG: TolB family protein [Flammeovirgaceae bacterium]